MPALIKSAGMRLINHQTSPRLARFLGLFDIGCASLLCPILELLFPDFNRSSSFSTGNAPASGEARNRTKPGKDHLPTTVLKTAAATRHTSLSNAGNVCSDGLWNDKWKAKSADQRTMRPSSASEIQK